MGENTLDSRRVSSVIHDRLTNWFEDYLSESIGEDILSCYYDGFTVGQVAADLNEAIKKWANDENNLQALTELVLDCADEYLDGPEEF